jgi:hypothetical protein
MGQSDNDRLPDRFRSSDANASSGPALDLHLEQNPVVNGRDALMRRLVVGELLGSLDQQRVLDLVEWGAGARYRLPEVFAQASQGRPRLPCHG